MGKASRRNRQRQKGTPAQESAKETKESVVAPVAAKHGRARATVTIEP